MTPPPVHDATAIAEIAKGLTYIEQCFLHEGRVRMSYPFQVQARDRLVSRGLVRKRWFGYRFTPLGLALRAHISQAKGE